MKYFLGCSLRTFITIIMCTTSFFFNSALFYFKHLQCFFLCLSLEIAANAHNVWLAIANVLNMSHFICIIFAFYWKFALLGWTLELNSIIVCSFWYFFRISSTSNNIFFVISKSFHYFCISVVFCYKLLFSRHILTTQFTHCIKLLKWHKSSRFVHINIVSNCALFILLKSLILVL